MAGLNLDDILSDFEGKPKSAPSKGLDIDSILSEFDSKPADIKPKAAEKVLNNGYGLGAPEDRFKPEFGSKEVPKTRRTLPTTNIEESIVDAFKSGRETFSEGLSDIGSNRPASGVGKVAMGALGTVVSPITGLIEGGVATPVADVTGSKRIGDTAGLVVGSGLPVVKGAAAVSGALPKNKALSTLVENIGRENLPSVVAALKANPRLAPADLSPRVLQDTQHLFANEGPQIDYLAKASASRMASSKAAVNDAYDTSGGVSPDLAAKVQELANAARKVGTEAIQPAIKDAKPVDITSTLAEIDKVLKPGVTSVISGESSLPLTNVKKELAQIKAMLGNDKEMRTNAADLHKFQSGLRTTAESLMRSATAADKEMGKSLMNVRNNLVADIDAASGGKYKPALSSYRDEMHIADSFRDGYEGVFSSSKKMENDPSFTKKWFDGLTDAEKQAAIEGARARIATEIGTARNPALAGESFSRSDFNQEKLATLFGKEEAAKLIKTLQEERTIANTHNKIIEGSQTAMRTASKSQFALPTATEVMKSGPAVAAAEASSYFMGGIPGAGAALLGAAKAGAVAKDAIKMKLAREHNARYAQYALPTEGPSREALIAALEAQIPGPKPSLVTRGANALSRIVAP
jgi:hypothetical protein